MTPTQKYLLAVVGLVVVLAGALFDGFGRGEALSSVQSLSPAPLWSVTGAEGTELVYVEVTDQFARPCWALRRATLARADGGAVELRVGTHRAWPFATTDKYLCRFTVGLPRERVRDVREVRVFNDDSGAPVRNRNSRVVLSYVRG